MISKPVEFKRAVFHFAGFDASPPEAVFRRFVRELRRFENTWAVKARAEDFEVSAHQATWYIIVEGKNWRVQTKFHLVRWDDLIRGVHALPTWRRLPQGIIAFVDFIFSGALTGYIRQNWRYAAFFLYPFFLLGIVAVVAALSGFIAYAFSNSAMAALITITVVGYVLFLFAVRQFKLNILLDDWILAKRYIDGAPAIDTRMRLAVDGLHTATKSGEFDDILVLAHSLGCVLAVDFLGHFLDGSPACAKRISFVTVGSSILKIGLHKRATRFRAALRRVASSNRIFWGEFQALTDVMNFYKTNPLSALNIESRTAVLVRIVRIRDLLNKDFYRKIRSDFLRVHSQFVSANDKRNAYDYFMLLGGPVTAENQIREAKGMISYIAEDGSLRPEGFEKR